MDPSTERMIGTARHEGDDDGGRTILAGFEPFDGRRANRSWDLVQKFRGTPGVDVFRLPVDFAQLRGVIGAVLDRRPRALLMVGESPIQELRVEQLALNVADAERPDNAGRLPQNERIVKGGPLALMTSWNARRVAGRLHQEGIPATVSFHAGTFACNAALYLALIAGVRSSNPSVEGGGLENGGRAGEGSTAAVGFFHVPNSRGPSRLGVANLSRAVELGMEELLAVDGG